MRIAALPCLVLLALTACGLPRAPRPAPPALPPSSAAQPLGPEVWDAAPDVARTAIDAVVASADSGAVVLFQLRRGNGIGPGFDPLAAALEAAGRRGLPVHVQLDADAMPPSTASPKTGCPITSRSASGHAAPSVSSTGSVTTASPSAPGRITTIFRTRILHRAPDGTA